MRSMKRTLSRAATVAVAAFVMATGLTSCIATYGPRHRYYDHDHYHSRYQHHPYFHDQRVSPSTYFVTPSAAPNLNVSPEKVRQRGGATVTKPAPSSPQPTSSGPTSPTLSAHSDLALTTNPTERSAGSGQAG